MTHVLAVPGVTFVASTGDYGAADPEYPAFSPNVVAVGGTTLNLTSDGSYDDELGWGDVSGSEGTFIGSGGGISQYESEPAYQQGVQATGNRTTPDVALLADPATGAWIADPYNLPGANPFEVVGGTSLSAPAWAGLLALADQGRSAAGVGALNSTSPTETQQALYSLPQSDYNVVNGGSNGYAAEAGYNLVTGLGTPVANLLITDLVNYQGPGTAYAGAKVGPLQDATLSDGGAGSAGSQDAFNVFDSLLTTSFAAGQPQNPGAIAVSNMQQGQVTALPRDRATALTSTTTIFIYTPSAGAAPGLGLAGPSPLVASHVATNTQSDTGFVPQRGAIGPISQSAEASRDDDYAPLLDVSRSPQVSDRVLDDLVTGLVSRRSTALSSVTDPAPLSVVVTSMRGGQDGGRTAGAGMAPLPAGPISRSDRRRTSRQPGHHPVELLLVGGFCGFGAGLMAVRNAGARMVSSRGPFWNRRRPG